MQSESKYFITEEIDLEFFRVKLKDSSFLPKVSEWDEEVLTKNKNMSPPEKLDTFHTFPIRDDDIWIITNDRCGTTWTQELTWLILNNLDYQAAKSVDLELRSPFLEFPIPTNLNFNELPSPRLMKTHLPMQLLPREIWTKKPKIIYVVRDPRDAFVSSYYQHKFFLGVNSVPKIEEYVEEMMEFSCFWEHVLSFYKLRHEENLLFYSFEQMKMNLKAIVQKVCQFVGRNYQDDQIQELLDHLNFKNMKDNESCSHRLELEQVQKICNVKPEDIDPSNKFIRKGIVGGYKNELSSKFVSKMDDWEKAHLEKFGLSLKHILFT